jgi:hypothetical protein
MDHRKKRESQSSHRNGRTNISARETDSRIPFGLDRSVSALWQFVHVICTDLFPRSEGQQIARNHAPKPIKTSNGPVVASIVRLLGVAIFI